MRRGDIVQYGTSFARTLWAKGAVGVLEHPKGECYNSNHKKCITWYVTWVSLPPTWQEIRLSWHSACLRRIGHIELPPE